MINSTPITVKINGRELKHEISHVQGIGGYVEILKMENTAELYNYKYFETAFGFKHTIEISDKNKVYFKQKLYLLLAEKLNQVEEIVILRIVFGKREYVPLPTNVTLLQPYNHYLLNKILKIITKKQKP